MARLTTLNWQLKWNFLFWNQSSTSSTKPIIFLRIIVPFLTVLTEISSWHLVALLAFLWYPLFFLTPTTLTAPFLLPKYYIAIFTLPFITFFNIFRAFLTNLLLRFWLLTERTVSISFVYGFKTALASSTNSWCIRQITPPAYPFICIFKFDWCYCTSVYNFISVLWYLLVLWLRSLLCYPILLLWFLYRLFRGITITAWRSRFI